MEKCDVNVYAADPDHLAVDRFTGAVIFNLLEPFLRSAGFHVMHGAAVGSQSEMLLITGASGAGKSTACSYLENAGYRSYCDDKAFWQDQPDHVFLWPFAERQNRAGNGPVFPSALLSVQFNPDKSQSLVRPGTQAQCVNSLLKGMWGFCGSKEVFELAARIAGTVRFGFLDSGTDRSGLVQAVEQWMGNA